MPTTLSRALGLLCALVTLAVVLPAQAVPSFARQTGQPCTGCHITSFGVPLNNYGRMFKLNGYVWGTPEQGFPPIAAMVLASDTSTRKGQPGGAAPGFDDNNNAALDQISLFYAGRIADKVGTFTQVTYSDIPQDHKSSWDNLDVRYADNTIKGSHKYVYGVSVNNSPTVQDLWNTTPAWSYPYVSSDLAPSPSASAVVEEAFAQQVLGVTGYALIDEHYYLEFGGYGQLGKRSLRAFGLDTDGIDTISGFAPYLRLAYQKNLAPKYTSIGLIAFAPQVRPGDQRGIGTNKYLDVGLDASYQLTPDGPHLVSLNGAYVHERQKLDASQSIGDAANRNNHLDILRLNGTYAYQQTYVLSLASFDVRGSRDSGLYVPNPLDGSRTNSPNSSGLIGMVEYVPFGKLDSTYRPWMNLRLGLQYTDYFKFNGASSNYDGSGRSASDNNTFFFFTWLAI